MENIKNKHILRIAVVALAIFGWIALPFILQDKVEASAETFGNQISATTFGTATPSPSPSISPTVSPTPGNPGDLYAGLTGSVNGVVGYGFAQYEIHSSRLELEIRVRQINLPAGTVLAAFVNGNQVGQFQLESDREGRLRLRSDRGDPIPQVTSGTSAEIRAGGNTILTGTFAGFSATPSPTPTGSPSPSPSPSPGFGRYFETHPTGSGMTPPVSTAATGEIKILLNVEETLATITGEFHNLSSNQTSATISVDLGGDLTTVYDLGTIGGTNGNISTRTVGISPAQVTQLRAGMWVATIASANNPAGELRGILRQHSDRSDFNGDGNNDFSVFRPSNGTWYTQNPSGFSSAAFGTSTDQIVSGDYDGDGRTDVAVFRPSNGAWYILRSFDGGFTGTQFGAPNDIPVRGDYDGDGRNDLAVFRPSNGTWYISRSSDDGFQAVTFGLGTDKPIAEDFDGDGKTDIAVFRPSNGAWYVLRSSNGGFQAVTFGISTDIPVRGDFDGDGKADYTVYRPSNGVWYISRSSDGGFQAATFGISEDIPVAGIYDSDNKTDIAVFRPSTGAWYILRSSDGGFEGVTFGTNGDIPVISR